MAMYGYVGLCRAMHGYVELYRVTVAISLMDNVKPLYDW